jgi:uncharacterized protein YdaU (DUF1376 family)
VAKSPAYPMYAQDFDMDTKDWTALEIGIYIRWLNYEWINGSIPSDITRLARIAGIDPRTCRAAKAVVLNKFVFDSETNMYTNRRMEEERGKQEFFKESQRLKGIKSGEKRKKKVNRGSTGVQPKHEPNVNLSSSSSFSSSLIQKNNNIYREFPPKIDNIKNYCLERKNGINAETFFDHYESRGWMIGKNKMKDWSAAVRTWERNNKDRPIVNQSSVDAELAEWKKAVGRE